MAIEAEGLAKSFGDVRAVDGVDLAVRRGSVYAYSGPTAPAGRRRSACWRRCSGPTPARPACSAHDIVAEAEAVRERVSLTGQIASVDEHLTGRENLVLFGRLLGMRCAEARERAAELLDAFGLAAAGGRLVKTYSGGMRRRLDIAASIVVTPELMFLDEPRPGSIPVRATRFGTSCAPSSPRARRSCCALSTSRRPTNWPTASP